MVTGVRSHIRYFLNRFKTVSSLTDRRDTRNRHSNGRGRITA
jgi:hypothetical protein